MREDGNATAGGGKPAVAYGFVVIGRNEGARLVRSLESIKGAAPVVYVDSGSTDDSVAEARSRGAVVVELDMSTPFTAARARNAGFRALIDRNPAITYVQFLDGDCELLAGWIDAATAVLDEHADVAAVCGQRFEKCPEASIYNRMCAREWDTPIGEAKSCGGESLVRRGAFETVGGFRDDQIAHEEPELCGRLREAGFKIRRIDQAMSLHDAAIYRISQFYARSRRAGFGITQYLAAASGAVSLDGREIIARALVWAVLLPVLILTAVVLAGSWALLLLLIYPLQIARQTVQAGRAGYRGWDRFRVATLNLVGKVAEAHGSLEYVTRRLLRQTMRPIVYK